jgi:NAD-dependent histone deacetylase SIR2
MFTDPGEVSVTLDSEHIVHESTHVDPLGEKNQPSITPDKEFLALQVQVFLEASEDVDVDAETIEDILDVLVDDDKNDEPEDLPEVRMHECAEEDEDSQDGENLLSQIVTNLPGEIAESEPQGFNPPTTSRLSLI